LPRYARQNVELKDMDGIKKERKIMPIVKTLPHYWFLAEHYSQLQPGLQCLHNAFQHAGLLPGNSEMHSLHICRTVPLSQTPLHLPSDHTACETNPPPSAVFEIWQRHMVGDNWYRAVLPQWHEMKTGTVHTCALLCNVKRLTMKKWLQVMAQ